MAGNNPNRPGVRRAKKKTPLKGTGGHGRKALEGKGPTPKAEDRVYHKAYGLKKAAARRAAHEAGVVARQSAKSKYRPHVPAGNELVGGRNPVLEIISSGAPVRRLFIASGVVKDERLAKTVQKAAAAGLELVEVSRADLDALTGTDNHQGIAVEVKPYQYATVQELWEAATGRWEAERAAFSNSAEALAAELSAAAEVPGAGVAALASGGQSAPLRSARPPLLVALDQVSDPHNLGAVLRSAAAFGADGVIIPQRRSAPVNSAAWKVSAGAAAIVPVAQATNLTRALQDLAAEGAFVVGLDGGGDVSLPDLELTDVPLVLVTGSEGAGLSRLVRETCDQIVSIPIEARMESLNAAVATGIALYQVAVSR